MVLNDRQLPGYQSNQISLNAQTLKLHQAIDQGEPLSTRRSGVLGQVFFCEGCCCGRCDKGFPPLPKEQIKHHWKQEKLNSAIQLTISGCLGPCDLANVCYILAADGTGAWFGGLSETWHYEVLIRWAMECRNEEALLPIPASLEPYRFTRFQTAAKT